MKGSKGLLSFVLTVLCYVTFFLLISFVPGNEADNSIVAMGAFVAMTFFINFPIVWWVLYLLLRITI